MSNFSANRSFQLLREKKYVGWHFSLLLSIYYQHHDSWPLEFISIDIHIPFVRYCKTFEKIFITCPPQLWDFHFFCVVKLRFHKVVLHASKNKKTQKELNTQVVHARYTCFTYKLYFKAEVLIFFIYPWTKAYFIAGMARLCSVERAKQSIWPL